MKAEERMIKNLEHQSDIEGWDKNDFISMIANLQSQLKERDEVIHRRELLRDYFSWHEEKGFVSHKPSDIDDFLSEQ